MLPLDHELHALLAAERAELLRRTAATGRLASGGRRSFRRRLRRAHAHAPATAPTDRRRLAAT